MSDFETSWTAAYQAFLSFIISRSLLRLMSIESVMPSNHLILCRPLLLPPSIFPSIRVFSSESVLHIRRPKYWSFSFSISFSNEYSGLISFRIDWFDLAVQGTLESSPAPQFSPCMIHNNNSSLSSNDMSSCAYYHSLSLLFVSCTLRFSFHSCKPCYEFPITFIVFNIFTYF